MIAVRDIRGVLQWFHPLRVKLVHGVGVVKIISETAHFFYVAQSDWNRVCDLYSPPL